MPPFLPVEGYTSFLWVVLLDLIWRLTGVAPPESANLLSLSFSLLTLLLTALLLLRVTAEQLRPWRLLLLVLGLLIVLSNRTFLAWTSSGLETALFNFLVLLWVTVALWPATSKSTIRWAFALCFVAALSALTRPDGMLLAASSVVLVVLHMLTNGWAGGQRWNFVVGLIPLLIIPIHLLWRFATYGAWLPNTYFAKSATNIDRMESGPRYLLTFVMEYSLWIWFALAGLFLGITLIRRPWLRINVNGLTSIIVITTLIVHMSYYTFLIGGDHFEFRVYSQIIPLIAVSFIWMLGRISIPPALASAMLILFLVCSWPIQWIHWAASQQYTTREETGFLKVSVVDAVTDRYPGLPAWLMAYLQRYDDNQFWLIDHAIGMRHQEHKVLQRFLTANIPPRDTPPFATGEGHMVTVASSVGVLAWSLPWANVIDALGLNDYVIARNPDLNTSGFLAHERQPPPGYLACFAPELGDGTSRYAFIAAERIQICEQTYRANIGRVGMVK
ncbi:hypothetical protein [Candidatus Chloroploca asiatica]|uniref:Glycosyltransferase RgtA/B/C/D-like domain-containing protein n=1 Tax=Candidatus Chloroploca asiatica TaxID=1506545 RepID=A0A2H3KNA1_9CHLR|nr:hypothetical protein [Candidatus Chloroploca asiatica]PDV99656.1 hypothetical protein A9Q02_00065 [Candidatus Chloroploca asiatica]